MTRLGIGGAHPRRAAAGSATGILGLSASVVRTLGGPGYPVPAPPSWGPADLAGQKEAGATHPSVGSSQGEPLLRYAVGETTCQIHEVVSRDRCAVNSWLALAV